MKIAENTQTRIASYNMISVVPARRPWSRADSQEYININVCNSYGFGILNVLFSINGYFAFLKIPQKFCCRPLARHLWSKQIIREVNNKTVRVDSEEISVNYLCKSELRYVRVPYKFACCRRRIKLWDFRVNIVNRMRAWKRERVWGKIFKILESVWGSREMRFSFVPGLESSGAVFSF